MGELQGQSSILIVTAMAREYAPLARRKLAGVDFLATGEGRANAERALCLRLDREQVNAVICMGLAGALSPALQIGDLIIDKRHWCGVDVFSAVGPLAAHLGRVVTVDEIVGASGKRQLSAKLEVGEIACVDMESAAVAKICEARGIPYLLVRAISDSAGEDLPIDFNACRDASGRVSTVKVLRAVAGKPKAVKGLLELNRRAKLGATNLAEFAGRLLDRHLRGGLV